MKRTEIITLKLTKDEKGIMQRMAKANNAGVSEYIRKVCLEDEHVPPFSISVDLDKDKRLLIDKYLAIIDGDTFEEDNFWIYFLTFLEGMRWRIKEFDHINGTNYLLKYDQAIDKIDEL